MWQNATEDNCIRFSSEQCGWVLNENKIEPLWFAGDPTPLLVEHIVSVELDEVENNENDIDIDYNNEYDYEDYDNHNDDNDNIDDNNYSVNDDDDGHNEYDCSQR